MRSRTSVIYISYNMQMIHRQSLDQLTKRHNKRFCSANSDDRAYNGVIIRLFVRNFRTYRDQLLDHISKFFRQCLSHFWSCVFACCAFTHFNQPVQCNLVPVLHTLFGLSDPIHLFFWIINKSSQRLFVSATQSISKYIINFTAHRTWAVLQHMWKRLIFSVNIRQEMFGSFRKIQNCLKINNLRWCLSDGRVQLRKSLQITFF